MNFSKLIYLILRWSFSNAESAIFFELEEKRIVEIGEHASEVICKSCISACPVASNSPTEKLLNDSISITGNGIFLRDVYSKPIATKEVEEEICENRYTPALVFDNVLKSFDVGYELYYKKGQTKLTSHLYDYFFKVVDGKGIPKLKVPPTEDVIVYNDEGTTVFEIVAEPGIKYVFYWIKVLVFEMRNKKRHRIVTYTADAINDFFHRHKTMNKCEFYYSGDGRIIWDKNSEKEDKEVGIHQTLDETPPTSKEPKEIINRLIKTQIIPMHMFHAVATRLATCVYLNFAFVWETIAKNQLKEIDLFLYAIYREWPLETNLWFGVNVHKQQIDRNALNEVTSEDHLFLKFPLPEVLFRFIQVRLKNDLYYGAVVVVHNVLEPVKDTDRICSAEEEMNGWNYLKNTNSVTGFSYVCPLIEEVLTKLKAELRSEYYITEPVNLFFLSVPLRLDKFPLLDVKTNEIREENVLERIEKRLRDIKQMIFD